MQLLRLVPGAAEYAAPAATALRKQLGPAHGDQGEGEDAPGRSERTTVSCVVLILAKCFGTSISCQNS